MFYSAVYVQNILRNEIQSFIHQQKNILWLSFHENAEMFHLNGFLV